MASIRHRSAAARETARCKVLPVSSPPEMGSGIVGDVPRRLIREEQLNHHSPRSFGPVGLRLHLHSRGRGANAAGRKHALTFDLNHAGAAIAVRPISRLGRVTQARQVYPVPARGLKNGLAFRRFHVPTVESKANKIAGGLLFCGAELGGLRDCRTHAAAFVVVPIAHRCWSFLVAHSLTLYKVASGAHQVPRGVARSSGKYFITQVRGFGAA